MFITESKNSVLFNFISLKKTKNSILTTMPVFFVRNMCYIKLKETTHAFNAIHKNFNGIFHRIRINNPKICMDLHRSYMDKAIVRNSKAEGSMFPDL